MGMIMTKSTTKTQVQKIVFCVPRDKKSLKLLHQMKQGDLSYFGFNSVKSHNLLVTLNKLCCTRVNLIMKRSQSAVIDIDFKTINEVRRAINRTSFHMFNHENKVVNMLIDYFKVNKQLDGFLIYNCMAIRGQYPVLNSSNALSPSLNDYINAIKENLKDYMQFKTKFIMGLEDLIQHSTNSNKVAMLLELIKDNPLNYQIYEITITNSDNFLSQQQQQYLFKLINKQGHSLYNSMIFYYTQEYPDLQLCKSDVQFILPN